MGIRLDRGLDGKYIAEVLRYYFPLSTSSSPFQSTTDFHRLTDGGGGGGGGSGDHHHHQHSSSPRQIMGMKTRDPQDEDDEDDEEEKNGSTSRRHTGGGGGGGGGKKNDRQIRDTLAARLPDEVHSRVVDSSKDYNSRVKGLVGSVESTQGLSTQPLTLTQQPQSQSQQSSQQQSRQSPVTDTLVRFSDGSNEIIRDDRTAKIRESNDVDGNTMAWDNHNDHHHNNNNHHHSTSNSNTNNTSNNNDYFLSPSHDLEQFLQAYPQHVYDGLDLDADSGEMTKDNAEQFYSIVLPMADRNLYSALKQEKW